MLTLLHFLWVCWWINHLELKKYHMSIRTTKQKIVKIKVDRFSWNQFDVILWELFTKNTKIINTETSKHWPRNWWKIKDKDKGKYVNIHHPSYFSWLVSCSLGKTMLGFHDIFSIDLLSCPSNKDSWNNLHRCHQFDANHFSSWNERNPTIFLSNWS